MPYVEPGTTVIQELAAEAVTIQSPDQVLVLVGELYEVLEQEAAADRYDPSTGAGPQDFTWPGKKTTSVVDLAGVRSDTSEPDDQLLEAAPFPMVVELRDPETLAVSVVNLINDVSNVNQTGFRIAEGVSSATARSSGSDVSSAEEGKFYKASGGFVTAGVSLGDRVRLTNGVFDVLGEVTAFTDSEITYDTGGAPVVDTPVIDSSAGLAGVDGDALTTPGKVASATGGFTAAAEVNDRIVIWTEDSEFDDGNGTTASTVTTAGGHGLTVDVVAGDSPDVGRRVTIHSANAADGAKSGADGDTGAGGTNLNSASISFVPGDVGKVVRVSGGTAALPNTYRRIVAHIDGSNVTVDSSIPTTGAADADVVVFAPIVRSIVTVPTANSLTYNGVDVADGSQTDIPVVVHTAVRRNVTAVDDDNTLTYSGTAVTSNTGFLLNLPFDLFEADLTYEVWPDYEVLSTYRALDVTSVDDTISVSQVSEVAALGDTSPNNPLLFAADRSLQAMGTDDVPILLMSVDLWTDQDTGSKTGLPEDVNELGSYAAALEVMAAKPEAYYTVPLTQNSAVRDSFETHVNAMSVPEEKKERLAYFSYKIPLGDVESTSGVIEPGRDGGNKLISDPGQGFITTHGVIPGKQVVVVSPAAYAGEYTTAAGTDDDDLYLEGADWTLTPEFTVTDGDFDAVSGEVSTVTADAWKDVDVGDWIVSGGQYRKITAKTSSTLLVYEGGALSGTGATVSILRSAVVEYYVDPLSKAEQASALEAIAQARANKRIVNMWPDEVEFVTGQDNLGNDVKEFLPSYFAAAVEAARDSVLRPERSSTGASLAGPTNLRHSNRYFDNSQLNTIANGGWAILHQPATQGPVLMRHLLSSDRSTIKRQEVSFTKNVDNMAKVTRASMDPSLNDEEGRVNITEQLLGALIAPLQGVFEFFEGKEQLVVGPNGERPWTVLSLSVSENTEDQIDARAELTAPIPGNKLEVTFVL